MPPRKGQRQARGLARQQQILVVAFELFAIRGYRATSLAQVAERAGLTEPGLLHHFPSKEALLLAVLAHRDATDLDAEAWVAASPSTVEAVRRLGATAAVLEADPLLARFDVVVGSESLGDGGPPQEHFRDRLRGIRRALEGLVDAGVRNGQMAAGSDPAAVALEAVAFMDGVQTVWLIDPSVDLAAAYTRYFDALADRLAA